VPWKRGRGTERVGCARYALFVSSSRKEGGGTEKVQNDKGIPNRVGIIEVERNRLRGNEFQKKKL